MRMGHSEAHASDITPSAHASNEDGPWHAGVALVAHLLQQRSPKHLTLDLLHALEALLRAVAPAEALHTAVLQRLLLNLRLWAAAPLPIQRSFQALLLKLAKVLQCACVSLCFPSDWSAPFLSMLVWVSWSASEGIGLDRIHVSLA